MQIELNARQGVLLYSAMVAIGFDPELSARCLGAVLELEEIPMTRSARLLEALNNVADEDIDREGVELESTLMKVILEGDL
jgi:hypothetical protein